MYRYLVILLLSSTLTAKTDGLQKIKKRMLKEPAYRNLENNYVYNPYKDERIDDYNEWEQKEDREGDFNDEEMKFVDYVDQEKDSRRLFEWFSRLFQSTTPRAIQTTMTTTESSYQRDLKERIFLRALHRNLSDILFKLSEIEKRVSTVMDEKEAYAILTKGKPHIVGLDKTFYYRDRVKRDVANAVNTQTVTKNAVTEKSDINASTEVGNAPATDCSCDKNVTSGRRAGARLASPTEVKSKLLLYLQESFQEIKSKIMSLKNLKQAFSDNVSFKIGYILANIDTLEISMLNLKNNMDNNKELWEDNKILELYDTLKVSNQAVSGLIEALRLYLEKLSQQPLVRPELNLG